jgi:hypothetical protein
MSNNLRTELEARMFQNFDCVNTNKNIVFIQRNKLSEEQLLYIIEQYAQFPRSIVSILVTAAYNFGYHGWTDLVAELRQNVFEELGGSSGEIANEFGPHYSILRKEVQNVFSIDIHASHSSKATAKFLNTVKSVVDSDPYIAAGGAFALEASAVPELEIVMKLVNQLAALKNKPLTKNLQNFFHFHVNDIEVGHRDRLINIIEHYLCNNENFSQFVQGYERVLEAMDIWWIEMYKESNIKVNEKSKITH